MSMMRDLNRILKSSWSMYRRTLASEAKGLVLREHAHGATLMADMGTGILIRGDNRKICRELMDDPDFCGKLSLIYIDPPFYSMNDRKSVVKAGDEAIRHASYRDKWEDGCVEYLKMLTPRLMLMRDLLAEDGLIFVHVDWHAGHLVRMMMDEIFGEDMFVNEIIWQYKSGGATRKRFSRKHDNIYIYSKTKNYRFYPLAEKSYNRDFKPYRFKGIEEFCDETGWYTLVNMKDVWNIDMVGRTSAERTGYATQKPEKLLERIISCCTEKGDFVADFFCGSGTTGVAAAKLGRRFIIVDSGCLAAETAEARLIREGISFDVFDAAGTKPHKMKAELEVSSKEGAVTVSLGGIKSEFIKNGLDASADTLKSVLSWSIDFGYDGAVHRPSLIMTRERGRIKTTVSGTAGRTGMISVKVTDIFGETFYREFTV